MNQEEKSNKDETNQEIILTMDQWREIWSYPDYWQPTLYKAAKRGESIKETYEELKDFENLM